MNHLLFSALVMALPHSGKSTPKPPSHPSENAYYGMYFNGNKAGWMHIVAGPKPGQRFVVTVESHIKMRSLGHVSESSQMSERVFSTSDDSLVSLSESDSSANGQVKIVGHRTPTGFEITTTRGADVKVTAVRVEERLSDDEADVRLAEHPVVGESASALHFDAIQQRTLHGTYTVRAVETKNGVADTVHISSAVQETREVRDEWLDSKGHMVALEEGPLQLRPEPAETVRNIEVKGDVAEDMLVHAPVAIAAPQRISEVQVDFEGMGNDFVPPDSPRQQVAKVGQYVSIMLHRDPPPMRSRIGEVNADASDLEAVQRALQPTSLIESDNALIVDTAKKIVGGEEDAFAASNRLVAYVARTLRKESIAGFGDALLVLQSGRGDCTEHSTLFVALARATGIPARIVQGITYVPQGHGFGWHAWSEVFISGRWIAVDPTFGQPIADATHVKMATGGAEMDGGVSQIMGKIKITQMNAR